MGVASVKVYGSKSIMVQTCTIQLVVQAPRCHIQQPRYDASASLADSSVVNVCECAHTAFRHCAELHISSLFLPVFEPYGGLMMLRLISPYGQGPGAADTVSCQMVSAFDALIGSLTQLDVAYASTWLPFV